METQAHGGVDAAESNPTATASKVDAAAKSAHAAVDRSAQALHQAAESLTAQGANVQELQETALSAVNKVMREKPLQAIGLAALAGFLLARAGGR